jgi:nicotinamide-nucleotide amidase
MLARAAGIELVVDEALEEEIESISRALAERLRRPYADFASGVTKQATRPVTAVSIGLAGTAPGLVFRAPNGCVVVVLPGPPGELRRLWPNALASKPMQELLARTRRPGRRVLRLFGVSESAVARALEEAGGDGGGVEATICAREFEIHVDLLVEAGSEERAESLEGALVERLEQWLFARDERRVEELVLSLAAARGLRLATAESCTGGMVAARLTGVPGSSASFIGGVVAYDDEVKRSELDVPERLLSEHGAVSAEVAAAMAEGARSRLGADVAVAVTGVAGPGGGTPEKPVGRVHVHAATPDSSVARMLDLPGEREQIRIRATVTALHLLRALLLGSRDEDA